MPTRTGVCPAKVGIPPTIRLIETDVKTTNRANNSVDAKLFIIGSPRGKNVTGRHATG
jgi:hypothetical protein